MSRRRIADRAGGGADDAFDPFLGGAQGGRLAAAGMATERSIAMRPEPSSACPVRHSPQVVRPDFQLVEHPYDYPNRFPDGFHSSFNNTVNPVHPALSARTRDRHTPGADAREEPGYDPRHLATAAGRGLKSEAAGFWVAPWDGCERHNKLLGTSASLLVARSY